MSWFKNFLHPVNAAQLDFQCFVAMLFARSKFLCYDLSDKSRLNSEMDRVLQGINILEQCQANANGDH